MTGETEIQPILDEMTRREVLWLGGLGIASIYLAKFAVWLRGIADIPTVAEIDAGDGYGPEDLPQKFESGWIERALSERPPLLSPAGEGNRAIVTYVCQNTLLLSEFLHLQYKDHLHGQTPERPPTLEEFMLGFFQKAESFLRERHPQAYIPLDEIIHFAMYALSEFCYPHIEQDKNFVYQDSVYDVAFEDPETGKVWGPKVIRSKFKEANLAKLPQVLSLDPRMCEGEMDKYLNCNGWDRLVHCIQHMFIGYIYTYTTINKLPERLRLPAGLVDLIHLGREVRYDRELLTAAITVVWELLETAEGVKRLFSGGGSPLDSVPTGYFDSKYILDQLANFAGGKAGENLAIGPHTWHSLKRILADLQYQLKDLPEQFQSATTPIAVPRRLDFARS